MRSNSWNLTLGSLKKNLCGQTEIKWGHAHWFLWRPSAARTKNQILTQNWYKKQEVKFCASPKGKQKNLYRKNKVEASMWLMGGYWTALNGLPMVVRILGCKLTGQL